MSRGPRSLLHALVALLGAAALALCVLPTPAATAATTAAAPDPGSRSAVTAAAPVLDLRGDVPRRGRSRSWPGHTLTYYESLPDAWDWSLRTAVARWSETGGFRFVRTTDPRRARLVIGYGATGTSGARATLGRRAQARIRLSDRYRTVDPSQARNQVVVMTTLAHELGHVLGFRDVARGCALMSSRISLCGAFNVDEPGHYACRTLDTALVARFVRRYGGAVRYPAAWCPVGDLPPPLRDVSISGGAIEPVRVRWQLAGPAPAGTVVRVSYWPFRCGPIVPGVATHVTLPPSQGLWEDLSPESTGPFCFAVYAVNRFGAAGPFVSGLGYRWAAPPGVPVPSVGPAVG